jgi:hypothetical protein
MCSPTCFHFYVLWVAHVTNLPSYDTSKMCYLYIEKKNNPVCFWGFWKFLNQCLITGHAYIHTAAILKLSETMLLLLHNQWVSPWLGKDYKLMICCFLILKHCQFHFIVTSSVCIWSKTATCARSQWLTPAILATWETETRRNRVWGHPGQTVHKTPSQK